MKCCGPTRIAVTLSSSLLDSPRMEPPEQPEVTEPIVVVVPQVKDDALYILLIVINSYLGI